MMGVRAFCFFVLISAITPGPNNIMSMANARQNGIPKALRFNWGVWIGFAIVLMLCAAFTLLLDTLIPKIEPYMLIVGAMYMLYLAWITLMDKPHKEKQSKLQLNSVFTGAVLQLINPKAIMYGITAFSAFVLPRFGESIPVLGVFCVGLAFVGFLCTCLWALFGATFEKLFSNRAKIVNYVMVALLVYCALTMLIPAMELMRQ